MSGSGARRVGDGSGALWCCFSLKGDSRTYLSLLSEQPDRGRERESEEQHAADDADDALREVLGDEGAA